RARLAESGMVFSGLSPDDRLVEMVELADHPWFVASQFHPEFRSRPNRPQPLFREFVGAARERMLAQSGRLPEEILADDPDAELRRADAAGDLAAR
ncbi:MAG TPA: hypothetical protein VML96_11540, partial [Egibacteraceae bacterium]|nr:hypothetical protein [Egibacteraceae bacterium]